MVRFLLFAAAAALVAATPSLMAADDFANIAAKNQLALSDTKQASSEEASQSAGHQLEPLPRPGKLTGYFSSHKDGDVQEEAVKAKVAQVTQVEAASKAADHVAKDLALDSIRAALKADAIVAVQQERAAHVSRAAQVSQAAAYNSAALSAKLHQAVYVMRTLETKALALASAARVLTKRAESTASLSVKATNLLNRIESDQQDRAEDTKVRARKLAYLQSESLNALANAQVAANYASDAAEMADSFKVSHPDVVAETYASYDEEEEDREGGDFVYDHGDVVEGNEGEDVGVGHFHRHPRGHRPHAHAHNQQHPFQVVLPPPQQQQHRSDPTRLDGHNSRSVFPDPKLGRRVDNGSRRVLPFQPHHRAGPPPPGPVPYHTYWGGGGKRDFRNSPVEDIFPTVIVSPSVSSPSSSWRPTAAGSRPLKAPPVPPPPLSSVAAAGSSLSETVAEKEEEEGKAEEEEDVEFKPSQRIRKDEHLRYQVAKPIKKKV